MKQTETQTQTVECPKAKVTFIKRKAGYGHQQERDNKKKRVEDMNIDPHKA